MCEQQGGGGAGGGAGGGWKEQERDLGFKFDAGKFAEALRYASAQCPHLVSLHTSIIPPAQTTASPPHTPLFSRQHTAPACGRACDTPRTPDDVLAVWPQTQ